MEANRPAKVVLVCLFLFLTGALVFYNCCLDALIAAMYRGLSLPFLNRLIHDNTHTPLSYYTAHARLLFSYLTLSTVVVLLVAAALFAHRYTRRLIIEFFTAPGSPLNLAVFRIVVFIGVASQIHASETIWFGRVPHSLQMAPFGVGWLLSHLPISTFSVTLAVCVLAAACVTGILGLFSRASAFIALLGAFYVLGVPEFYGTVEHYHHLLWFLAILAVSPCGDALSIDALRKVWRQSALESATPAPSIAYSLPLRFACLLLGLVYFFPGFWKFRISGFDWAFSDNLRYVMYARWTDLDAWLPFFRLDLHPYLFRSVALMTLLFELTFIIIIFIPRLRPFLALIGISFHFGSGLFLRIPFFDLWICYVALFNVQGFFERVGRKLFPKRLTVCYDPHDCFSRRVAATCKSLDVLNSLVFVVSNSSAPADLSESSTAIRVTDGEKLLTGAGAYRIVARRVPLLWLALPLLRMRMNEGISAQSSETLVAAVHSVLQPRSAQVFVTSTVALALMSGSIYCGTRGIVRGWPFACYPRFAWNPGSEVDSIQVSALAANGDVIFQGIPDLHPLLKYHAFGGQIAELLSAKSPESAAFSDRVRALWQLHVQQDPSLSRASIIRCYHIRLATVPDRRYLNPLQRDLIFELKL